MGQLLSRSLRDFEADHVWVHDHLGALLEKYPEQWIAVRQGSVIASDVDLDDLRAKLADPAHTCVEYITREPLEMVL